MKGSYTKTSTIRRCLRKAKYAYIDELQKVRRAEAIIKGSLLHSCLDAYYKGKDWTLEVHKFIDQSWGKMFDEERAQYGDIPGETIRIMQGYIRAYQPLDANTKTIASELQLIVPTPAGNELEVRIDQIVEDEAGLWVRDHKSCKTIPEENIRHTDIQTMLYGWAARQSGYEVMGTMLNYIRTKAPAVPALLKGGGISRALIDTDWHTYYKAVKNAGQDPADYEEMQEKLKGKVFFKRSRLPLNRHTVKNLISDFDTTLSLWEYMSNKHHFPRTLTRDCTWDCEYAPICFAELQGTNPETIIEEQYQKRGVKNNDEEYLQTEIDLG